MTMSAIIDRKGLESSFKRSVLLVYRFVTVFDPILTSRQTCEKLQCLYENQMSDNFRKTALLRKKINCNKATKQRIVLKKFGSVSVLKFLQRLAFDFPCNFSRDFLTDTCIENFKKLF